MHAFSDQTEEQLPSSVTFLMFSFLFRFDTLLHDVFTGFQRGLEGFSSSVSPTLKASKGADTETSRLGKLT